MVVINKVNVKSYVLLVVGMVVYSYAAPTSCSEAPQGPYVPLGLLDETFLEQLELVQQLSVAAHKQTPALTQICVVRHQEKKEVPLTLLETALDEAQRYVTHATGGTFKVLTAKITKVRQELLHQFHTQSGSGLKDTVATARSVFPTKPTSANIPNTFVSRDEQGNFAAGVITAALVGAASRNVLKTGDVMSGSLTLSNGAGVTFNNQANTQSVQLSAQPTSSYSLLLPKNQGGGGQVLLLSKTVPGQLEWGRGSDFGITTPASSLPEPGTLALRDSNGDFGARLITSDLWGNVVGDLTGKASENILRSGDTMSGSLTFLTSQPLGFIAEDGKKISVQVPATLNSSYTVKLPQTLGTSGQVLTVDGGQLGWTSLPSAPQSWQSEVQLTSTPETALAADDASNQLYNLNPVLIPIVGAAGPQAYTYGFLANSAAASYPQLVGRDTLGQPVALDAKQLIPLLVNEVKQLQTSHEELWKAITVLQGQINMRGKQL